MHTTREMQTVSIFREYMLVAYSTGARPNELMTMTWGDVRVNPQDSKEKPAGHETAEGKV